MFSLKLLPLLVLFGVVQQAAVPPAAPPTSATPSTFRISGRVIDAVSGQPLASAVVAIDASNPPNSPNSPDSTEVEVTAADGSFVFADLLPGKYVLSARHRGYIAQTYQQHESFTTAIAVGPGFESGNLIFGLRPSASISGEIIDESNDPIRHADVMLFHQTFAGGKRRTLLIQRTATDDEGHYHFGHLIRGTYFVGVSAQPWYAQHNVRHQVKQENQNGVIGGLQPVAEQNQILDVVYPVSFFVNASDLAGAAAITLRSGDTEIADFRMRPVPALHLLVKTSPADPGQGEQVQVMQPLAEDSSVPIPVGFTQVAPGLVEVTGVPPGSIHLGVNTHHGNEWTRRSQSVQVSSDAEIDATQNGSSVLVSGVLKMEDASPLPQPARVMLRSFANGPAFNTTVSATGEFSFKNNPVETGEYELIIIEPQALFIRKLTSSGAKTSGRSLEIATAQDVNVTITAVRGSAKITGIALKNDKPAPGAMIVLAPLDLKSNPALFRRDQADSDGTFALNLVVPGRYTLMAIEDGWDLEWADPDVLQKYIASGESVQIAANGKTEVKVKVK
jgi:protocatechuate 3,4-dioxygenase beta subunit